MTRTVHCPHCRVELTIPSEAGSKRLRCPKCSTRFYPDGRAGSGPSSSVLATRPATGGPGSSAARPASGRPAPGASRPTTPAPPELGDLRELLDVPFADETPSPPRPRPNIADVSSLLDDDGAPAPRPRAGGDARRSARRCPQCGGVVPVGMSLCEGCGLDIDTGEQYGLEEQELYEEPVIYASDPGPPASVLLIGLIVLVVALLLAALSLFQLEGIGRFCLTLVCLFGAFAGLQFLRGKAPKLMITFLLLGACVDLVVLVILPVVIGEETVVTEPVGPDGRAVAPDGSETIAVVEKPVAERIDQKKLTLGVAIFVVDAALLLGMAAPGVKRYFEKRPHHHESGYIIP